MLLDLGLILFFSSPIFITLIICKTIYKIKELKYNETKNEEDVD